MSDSSDNQPNTSFSIACLSHLGWDTKLFQRPQQVMSRLARRHRVDYFCQVPTRAFWSLPRTSVVCHTFSPEQNLSVHYLPYLPLTGRGAVFRTLNRFLYTQKVAAMLKRRCTRPLVLWLYHPKDQRIIGLVDADVVVYDCMDEFRAFLNSEPETREYERRILERADVVFAGGHSLYEAKRALNPNCHLFPCGVDYEHFASAASLKTEVAEEMRRIQHPVIGYVGAVDERLDYELIESCARLNPAWSFVLIGPLLKVKPDRLFSLPNVHYLGAKRYADLPRYMKAFDVAMMPFAITELTLKINPTKTLEYLSAGLPTVCTHVPDVVAEFGGMVRFCDSPSSFAEAIEHSLSVSVRARQELMEAARGKSWEEMVDGMERIVASALKAKLFETDRPC